jgi:DNA (cytosine-5)-methyltransferase 1
MDMKSIELFAGAGGLALGLEQAGFNHILVNEFDKSACKTLLSNRPNWNVCCKDISQVDFKKYRNKVDLLSGGFPCQPFSYAGKKMGLEDTRGTLFYEYARAVSESLPLSFVAENVRGLVNHNGGNTLDVIKRVFSEIGYKIVFCEVLNAVDYRVPQKRERLFLVGIKDDLSSCIKFVRPCKSAEKYTVVDALRSGSLYEKDVPCSDGFLYSEKKASVMKMVPEGGNWRSLPEETKRQYMKKSYFSSGGKTGIARRLSWSKPSLTLLCSPSQMQTDRCHPEETRPLTTREYARIQTFPDEWSFSGSISSVYKQIGNAVPVNLASSIGKSIYSMIQEYKSAKQH